MSEATPGPAPTPAGDANSPRRHDVPSAVGALAAAYTVAAAVIFLDPVHPSRAEPAEIVDVDARRSRTRGANGRSNYATEYLVIGRTSDGGRWEVSSEYLHGAAEPGDQVEVEFSRLSGAPVAVAGPGYDWDREQQWLHYLFIALTPLLAWITWVSRPAAGRRRVHWCFGLAGGAALGLGAAVLFLRP